MLRLNNFITRVAGVIISALFTAVSVPAFTQSAPSYEKLYESNCSACHGAALEGSQTGTPLVGGDLVHGGSIDEIALSIYSGFPAAGMPAWSETLDTDQIRSLAIMVKEHRSNLSYTDFKVTEPLRIPEGTLSSELQSFRIETVATDVDPFPFSIQPLPDGSILLTEKTKGLSIVSPDGKKSALITGTPKVFDDSFEMPGLKYIIGSGWLMDVAIDPDYEENGWVYLQYGDRCSDCNDLAKKTKLPVSMNVLVRGRIRDGAWVDEQTLWKVGIEQYTYMTDQAAGGRIAFDDDGHLFFSVGMKGPNNFAGIQDLGTPWGKIHRINRDGTIPADNPYVDMPGAVASIWTYGHRVPQGLEVNRLTGQLWGTEMGPRGGDEVNLLLPGRNYGWPLYSKGMNYDGTAVNYGERLGIELDLSKIEQPVVDLTPAPAVSSFIFYEGDQFPRWKHNMLVGTLKATELYRMVLDGDRVVHRETVLKGVGRIRDIETAPDGTILLLIEHLDGGRILRLVREDG